MDQRKKILGIIGGVVVFIAVLILITVLIDREPSDQEPQNQNETEQVQIDENGQVIPTVQAPVQQNVPAIPTSPELYVRQLSKIFVERFGSYSNQNNNQHIKDVDSLLSPTMRSWVSTQNQEQSIKYSGQTTRLISSSVTSFTDQNSAVVQIGVQQEKTVGNISEMVYRDGRVELVYQNGEWLIDGLYFE